MASQISLFYYFASLINNNNTFNNYSNYLKSQNFKISRIQEWDELEKFVFFEAEYNFDFQN